MEPIKITFLGTGSMIPTVKRSHTAILLTYKNENILIDCGEGTQRQFRMAQISPNKLTKLLITHWHGDHILGLPGLFQTLAMNDYNKELEIYGPRKTEYFIDLLKHLVKINLNLKIKELSSQTLDFGEFQIHAAEMSHGAPTLAFSFEIKEKLRLDKSKLKKLKLPHGAHMKQLAQGKDIVHEGKKIKVSQVAYKEAGRKVTFILDTAPNSNALALAKDSDILICESSFTQEEREMAKERLHLTAKDAAELAKKAKVKQLILTHISQRYEHNTQPVLDEAKKIFKNVKIVKDLDVVEI